MDPGDQGTVSLRDGSRVRIRPIEPGDREDLADGFARLSPDSRYRRFLAPKPRLTEADLDRFTRIDHHDHEALVAMDAETGVGVAVARYVRTGPDRAEPAVAVADDWQGRGLGTVLLDALADRAREEGVTTFCATVLATNTPALALLEGAGRATRTQEGREVVVDVELPAAEGAGPGLVALLRGVAAGLLAPRRPPR
jgi:GNAT superfamily N-acetyltransferase